MRTGSARPSSPSHRAHRSSTLAQSRGTSRPSPRRWRRPVMGESPEPLRQATTISRPDDQPLRGRLPRAAHDDASGCHASATTTCDSRTLASRQAATRVPGSRGAGECGPGRGPGSRPLPGTGRGGVRRRSRRGRHRGRCGWSGTSSAASHRCGRPARPGRGPRRAGRGTTPLTVRSSGRTAARPSGPSRVETYAAEPCPACGG